MVFLAPRGGRTVCSTRRRRVAGIRTQPGDDARQGAAGNARFRRTRRDVPGGAASRAWRVPRLPVGNRVVPGDLPRGHRSARRLLLARVRTRRRRSRSTPAGWASWPAITSNRHPIWACRWWVSVCSMATATSAKRSTSMAGSRSATHANDWSNMPVHKQLGADGTQLRVQVTMAGTQVHAAIWRAQVGRVPLYLLDTNLDENAARAARHHRISSTAAIASDAHAAGDCCSASAGCARLDASAVAPTVFHMNEGHSAFLGLERIRTLIGRRTSLRCRARAGRRLNRVHHPHPGPGGQRSLRHSRSCAVTWSRSPSTLASTWDDAARLWARAPGQSESEFGMTLLALRTSAFANGVSRLHGEVTRGMWQSLWPGLPVDEVPITQRHQRHPPPDLAQPRDGPTPGPLPRASARREPT